MRIEPDVQVRRNVACQSTRHGAKPVLIIIHDTEGTNIPNSARDLANLGDFFDRPTTQASSHVATDADGFSARYVMDDRKAWHCAFYNSVSLGIEQIGFAAQPRWPQAQLEETARWVALWSERHGIPIRKGRVTIDGRVTRSGVMRHSELGNLGGGHHDPGPNYPMADMLAIARRIRDR